MHDVALTCPRAFGWRWSGWKNDFAIVVVHHPLESRLDQIVSAVFRQILPTSTQVSLAAFHGPTPFSLGVASLRDVSSRSLRSTILQRCPSCSILRRGELPTSHARLVAVLLRRHHPFGSPVPCSSLP
jgi:hypothetical protein